MTRMRIKERQVRPSQSRQSRVKIKKGWRVRSIAREEERKGRALPQGP
jgi:hypothetical protein